jgi:hydroxymethylpyrimidine pyrophosphatase-like HAD family hydrolase
MISYNGAVITDLKEDKIILNKCWRDQIHELYEYSLKSKTHIITYIDGKVVSETNLEYIDIELTLQDYYIIKFWFQSSSYFISSKMHFIEEPTYLREVEKTWKAMPHLSVTVCQSLSRSIQNGIDKGQA